MLRSETRHQVESKEIVPDRLAPTLVRELSDIVAQSEETSPAGHEFSRSWSYGVPMAGVRYYLYDEERSVPDGFEVERKDPLPETLD